MHKNTQTSIGECSHPRIEQDEPRDGGGAYYRCTNANCYKMVDPDDWESEHDKEWDWWQK